MGLWFPHEEERLVKGCREGNRLAQKEVFQKLFPRLLPLCMRYSRNGDEARDILQNGFVKVFKNMEAYKGDGSFEGWVKRIVINTAIDNYRRKKVKSEIIDSDLTDRLGEKLEDENDEAAAYEQIPVSAVMEAVQRLSPAYKTVFNLYVVEGYNHIEIAEMLDISVGTSKSNLSKARLNLRKMLQPLVERLNA